MLKKKLFDCLSKSFFKDELRQRDYLLEQAVRELEDFKSQCRKRAEKAEVINSRCICVSNEHSDPIIGYATRLDITTDNPFVWVYDLLTEQEYLIAGKLMIYTPARLSAVLKLTPVERWMLLIQQNFKNMQDISHKENHTLLSTEQIIDKLNTTGFFEHTSYISFQKNKRKQL